MTYRAAIFALAVLYCGCMRPVTLVTAPPASDAERAWQRQITARVNALVECAGAIERTCIDEVERRTNHAGTNSSTE